MKRLAPGQDRRRYPGGESFRIDLNGERALPEDFDYLDFRADGYIQTCRGLLDRNGVEVFRPDTYWDVEPYNGLFKMQTEKGCGLPDGEKNLVAKLAYEEIWTFPARSGSRSGPSRWTGRWWNCRPMPSRITGVMRQTA